MSALTSNGPKCLVEIDGRTLLSRQIAALERGGVTQVALVGGWKIDGLRTLGLPVFPNLAWETTTMVHSLLAAESWIGDEPVYVAYGDIVFGSDIVERMVACDDDLVIAYDEQWLTKWSARFDNPLDDAESFKLAGDGFLVSIGDRAADLTEVDGQYMGLLLIRPNALEGIRFVMRTTKVLSMTQLLGYLVVHNLCKVRCVTTAEPWFEFDTVHDIEVGAEYLRQLDAIERAAISGESYPTEN